MELVDGQGRKVVLGEALGRGGEGEVHAVDGDDALVAKVFFPQRRTRAKHDKIHAMLQRPPAGAHDAVDGCPVLAWPRGLLYSSSRRGPGSFVGYTMPRIRMDEFVPFYQVTTAARRQRFGGQDVDWQHLVLLGARLCHVVRTLHRFGYAVGDLNDRNILVSRRFTPLLMDTDSFQVPRRGGHFPSTVGDQLYWPPELLGIDLNKHRKSRVEGDRFALATLLFQLFMNGNRPYQARGSTVEGLDTIMAKTREGHFPWAKPVAGVLEPPSGAPRFTSLPAPVQAGFVRCFVAGHKRPSRRPSPDWWYQELAKLAKQGFQNCTADARHVFSATAKACPWCADANDPFDARRRLARGPAARRAPVPISASARTSQGVRASRGARTAPGKATGQQAQGAAKAPPRQPAARSLPTSGKGGAPAATSAAAPTVSPAAAPSASTQPAATGGNATAGAKTPRASKPPQYRPTGAAKTASTTPGPDGEAARAKMVAARRVRHRVRSSTTGRAGKATRKRRSRTSPLSRWRRRSRRGRGDALHVAWLVLIAVAVLLLSVLVSRLPPGAERQVMAGAIVVVAAPAVVWAWPWWRPARSRS